VLFLNFSFSLSILLIIIKYIDETLLPCYDSYFLNFVTCYDSYFLNFVTCYDSYFLNFVTCYDSYFLYVCCFPLCFKLLQKVAYFNVS